MTAKLEETASTVMREVMQSYRVLQSNCHDPRGTLTFPSTRPRRSVRRRASSNLLADDQRATCHQILNAHLAADYGTAFVAMLYTMARGVLGLGRAASPLDVSLRPAMPTGSREVLKETVAQRMLDALDESLNIAWLEASAPQDFAQLSELFDTDKQALLAWCAASALNQQQFNDSGASAIIEAVGVRL